MSGLVLSANSGDFRAMKALIAAQYNSVDVQVKTVAQKKDDISPEFLAKNPTGKLPMLETPQGVLTESNAIARFIARIRRDTELFGRSFFESAQVDSWIDFGSHDLELPVSLWLYPILGYSTFDATVHADAVKGVHRALSVLEGHLLSRTYLVGETITLADICLAAALLYPFKMVFDAEVRETYPSVTRWFYTCANQPQFAAVFGDVPICEKAFGASAGGAGKAAAAKGGDKAEKAKKEKAPAAEKEKAPKKEKEAEVPQMDPANAALLDAPVEKKKVDPFAGLPKSTMDLDEWKRTYSNSKTDFFAVMPWFWEHLDKEGYSLWLQKYKYNNENTRDFMTSNLISGFVQRSDEVRKYAFGVMSALGDAAPYEVEGVWMIRGQSIEPLIKANDDAEYHDWIKLDPTNPEHQKMVAEYWCQPEKINGKTIMDGKCFK